MKASCVREKLVKGLGSVGKIVTTQVTLPILSNVLLSSDEGRLKIAATDLELGIETWVGAKIEEEGSITVPAKVVYELLNSIKEEKINIETKDEKVTLKGENFKSVIRGISANDFPLIPKIKDPMLSVNINSLVLKEEIIKNTFSCATDETRPVLSGVLFSITKDKIIMAATDSYRLTESVIEHSAKVAKDINIVIPKRTLTELSRIIGDKSEDVRIDIGENQISFSFSDVFFISRLIEGSFPEYKQIIPKEFKTNVVVDKKELVSQLKIASLFSKDNANNIEINIDTAGSKLIVVAKSSQLGENESQMKVVKAEGENVGFCVNAMFLQDILNALKEKEIQFKIVGTQNPIMVCACNDKNYLGIVMPLRQD